MSALAVAVRAVAVDPSGVVFVVSDSHRSIHSHALQSALVQFGCHQRVYFHRRHKYGSLSSYFQFKNVVSILVLRAVFFTLFTQIETTALK